MLSLPDFLGDWQVSRRIEDLQVRGYDGLARLSGSQAGRFEGGARLFTEGPGLRYHEEGKLTLDVDPEVSFVARRDYLWRWTGDRIEVLFADGRPFHAFVPSGRAIGTDHPCGHDLYRVTYDFTGWPTWTAEWIVTGPAKDYRMLSAYRRA